MAVWPAWEVREGERTTRWLHVRLAFRDGATIEALASVGEGWVCVEDVQARPALALEDLAVFADWIEGPLARACGAEPEPGEEETGGTHHREEPRRGRTQWPVVARAYRAAQERGADPVLAVMDQTGYSRRGALRLIGRTRDAGLLSPRHARR
ncbi:DUF6214 family protein [Streptomyces griseoincarnatus]|uniref:DUF6214 family protein n=1 Tax=Streptomyces labedae TaxID=285569 RepID=A0ABP6QUZ7_9ACTN|nr:MULTISPECIES: DUF6214 family protein [unclassified Streptomyces]NEA92693.1 hypothetical protein [Actinospica acidiphila]PWE11829.1 hypothetical protein DD630_00270 [Streptomyces sp. BSE7F]MBJ6647494.1 hypothetical protein [Streptomyces sp. BSE7-9]MCA2204588.1 DUF6214 family protein [Streptomyces sp. SMS_SU21]MDH3035136.1 DUF6214 family protein [Streptomyces sp. TRM75561]